MDVVGVIGAEIMGSGIWTERLIRPNQSYQKTEGFPTTPAGWLTRRREEEGDRGRKTD